LIEQTPQELAKIGKFLGINATPERILEAVQRSSADNMRKMEKAQSDDCSLTKTSRKDLPFVRAAKSGGWKSGLPDQLTAKIDAAWAPIMRSVGYEASTRLAQQSSELDLMLNAVSN